MIPASDAVLVSLILGALGLFFVGVGLALWGWAKVHLASLRWHEYSHSPA